MMKRSHRDNNARLTRQFVLILGLGVLLGFIVLLSPLRAPVRSMGVLIAQPFWAVGNTLAEVFSGVTTTLTAKSVLETENTALREEIATLRLEYYRAEIVENDLRRQMIPFSHMYSMHPITHRLILLF
jgi:cell shape-determining protein MreC